MRHKKIGAWILSGAMLLGLGLSPLVGTQHIEAADQQFAGEFWYDQIATVELNRELAHSHFIPYSDLGTALSNEESVFTKNPTNSSNVMSLNGTWSFHFAVNPAARLSDPDDETLQGGMWSNLTDTIKVPSSVEAQRNEDGTFKYAWPVYVNQAYPWGNYESVDYSAAAGTTAKAPTVKNGVSHFQRTFTLEPSWQADGRQVYISFEGVESAFYLYVNGQRVGYAEDSYTTDEFNITKYLKAAGEENVISVQVYRWSTGSYLENQDFIRLSGIFRDVNLYNRPALAVRDYFFKPSLTTDNNGQIALELYLRNHSNNEAAVTAEVQLYPQHGDTALLAQPLTLSATLPAAKSNYSEAVKDPGTKVEGTATLASPLQWSADQPNLYRAVITLKGADGAMQEIICQRIGFRNIESVKINESNQHQLRINGKKIYFRGTNRHESDLMNGRALGHEAIKQDLLMMKRNNINGIRTSHYPNDPVTYDLADELGIYLCDESNIESHRGATEAAQIPSAHKIWNNSVMDRTMNMVERDKNHPAVVIWSLGNEATYRTYPMNDNYCFWNSTQWILQRDPSRIRKYERDNRYAVDTEGNIVREQSMVDLYSTQYWGVGNVESHVSNKNNKLPYIQSEFSHAMGNAMGNFKEYWDIFRKYDNAHGGFIWDWIDQSLLTTIKNSFTYKLRDGDKTIGINGKFVTGRSEQALQGSYILENTSKYTAKAQNGMTLDVWFKLPQGSPLQGDLPLLSKGDQGYNLKFKNGKIELFFNGWAKGVLDIDAPSGINDGNWHRLTGTVDASGVFTLYYDGTQLKATGAIASAPFDTNNIGVGVGIDPEFQQRTWPGEIDAVRIMTKAMSAEEVAAGMVAKDAADVLYACDFTADDIVREGNENAVSFWGYGGDWDDKRLNDGNFVGNGIISADRQPTAKLNEVKKVHQEVNFYPTANVTGGEVKVVNEFPATDLAAYEMKWELVKNDKVIAQGDCSTELAPQTSKNLQLTLPDLGDVREGDDYFLNFHVYTKQATAWAEAGYEIASEQLVLQPRAKLPKPAINFGANGFASVETADNVLTVSGDKFSLKVDKSSGYITEYTYDGQKLLNRGPVPSYFRAPVDNDPKQHEDAVKNAAEKLTVQSVDVTQTDAYVQVVMEAALATNNPSQVTIKYIILPTGEVIVSHAADLRTNNILKVGMILQVPEAYSQVSYYGRGPWENYVDRKSGSLIGVYAADINKFEAENKYLRPQENGNRSDVRYVALRNAGGQGLLISSEEAFNMGASHYKAEDLSRFRHMYQVPRQEDILLTIDGAHRGLGNASCGPGPLPEYTLAAGKYAHTFRIQPLEAANSADDIMEMSKASEKSLNAVRDILVNGKSVAFNAQQKTYDVKIVKNTYAGNAPSVQVLPTSEKVQLEYEQPQSLPASVNVRAVSPLGVEENYIVNITQVESLYLSEMPWTESKSGYFTNTRDMCGSNKISLFVDDVKQVYDKGVGTHAPAAITVDIADMNLTKFTSRVGINTNQSKGAPSDVIFRVYVDGVEKYSQRVLAGESFPCEVDVTGASIVKFEVDSNGPDYNDHASWAEAKFTREEAAPPVDKSKLQAAYDEAQGKQEADYTPETWAPFADAVTAAKAVLAKTDASQSEVDEALQTLKNAQAALQKRTSATTTAPDASETTATSSETVTSETTVPEATTSATTSATGTVEETTTAPTSAPTTTASSTSAVNPTVSKETTVTTSPTTSSGKPSIVTKPVQTLPTVTVTDATSKVLNGLIIKPQGDVATHRFAVMKTGEMTASAPLWLSLSSLMLVIGATLAGKRRK